jgi:hypothetical protein
MVERVRNWVLYRGIPVAIAGCALTIAAGIMAIAR